MGAPAGYTADRKDGCVQLERKAQHIVHKAAVEVDVCADALIYVALFAYDLGRQALDGGVEIILRGAALFARQHADKLFKHVCPRVAQRVDGVTHAVNKARAVERLLVQQRTQIARYLFLIGPVLDLLFHVLDHLHDLYVGAAVAGALE